MIETLLEWYVIGCLKGRGVQFIHLSIQASTHAHLTACPPNHRNGYPNNTGATALIENGYPECGLELGGVILDVATEADKEAAKQQQQGQPAAGGQQLQPVPADLVRGVRPGFGCGCT